MAELDVVFGGQDNGLNGASMQNRLQGNLKNDNNQYNQNENIYGKEQMTSSQPQINAGPAVSETPETDAAIERIQKEIEKQKRFDFLNKSKIIEFKKRNFEKNKYPDFILEENKFITNMEIANKHNITFLYQNKFSNGKVWEWNINKMVEENTLPEPIVKEMNHYTYVNDQKKVPKKVYMLTLDMGYEI